MRSLIIAATAVLGFQTHAREVTIEDFDQSKRIGDDVADQSSSELPREPYPEVSSAMFVHFSADGKPAFFPRVGGTVAGLLGPQFTPGWRTPGSVNTLSHNVGNRQFAQCDGTTYLPTWWLSREAEARRSRYYTTMASIACEQGVSTNLLDAVIAQESGYKSWAVSSAGAMGIMQIMPGTARSLGLTLPFDPITNMRAGARYLRQQIDRFGRIDLALAAYNAGPERRSLQSGYIPAIPETRHYVRTITTNWARLASWRPEIVTAEHRGEAALIAVRASGYRSVELISYDGSNAANPM